MMTTTASPPTSFLDDPPSDVVAGPSAPARPPAWEEALAFRLFDALSPRLPHRQQDPPPRFLGPCDPFAIYRGDGGGPLSGLWFHADVPARGATLLLHPWSPWGKSYFYRRGRIAALRRAGQHAIIVDLPGFGASAPPRGFYDRVIEDALDAIGDRAGGLPLSVWGVSAGGYWAHPAIARRGGLRAAVFEDVAPHFLEWSTRTQPLGIPFYRLFRLLFRRAYRFLDLREHAPNLGLDRVLYIGGEKDRGIPVEDQAELARRAGGEHVTIPDAEHLESIKRAQRRILALGVATVTGDA